MLSIMYEEPFTFLIFKDSTLTVKELDLYTGLYSAADFPLKIQITHEKVRLTAQGTGQPAVSQEAIDTHIFQFEQAGVQMEFLPGESSMILRQGGHSYKMTIER